MRRAVQLAAAVAWILLAAHDLALAGVVLPALVLALVADDAPGIERLVGRCEPPRAPCVRLERRWRIPDAHRATGRRAIRAPFSSRPPPRPAG